MKRLKVELVQQGKGTNDCGPVSVQMILRHFGIDIAGKELRKLMTYVPGGTSIYDNGLRCQEAGLKTMLVTANPLLFPKEVQGKLRSKKALINYLSGIERKPRKGKSLRKHMIQHFKQLVKAGGKTLIEIPNIKHIEQAINKNSLVLALLFGRALGENQGGFHFVVVSGYKKGSLYINNPLPGSRTGWFPNEDFLYALHSSTCADIDNGSLLIVGKK